MPVYAIAVSRLTVSDSLRNCILRLEGISRVWALPSPSLSLSTSSHFHFLTITLYETPDISVFFHKFFILENSFDFISIYNASIPSQDV